MNQLSNRGAARVSAVWMIVVIVLFFVALAFAYVSNQAAEQAKGDRTAMASDLAKANTARDAALDVVRDITVALGWYDRDDAGSVSDPAAAQAALGNLQLGIPGLGDSISDFESVIPPILAAYNTQVQKVGTLESQSTSLKGQLTAAQAATRTTSSQLNDQLSTLQRERDDLEQSLNDRIAQLEGDLADMRASRNQIDDELNTEKERNDELALVAEQDASKAATRMGSLQRQLDDVQRRSETADGAVLAVSKPLGIGWIDRGTTDRISEGVVFEVRTGNPNPRGEVTKGFAEVIEVEAQRSKVRIFDVADPFDPVVTGDKIFNPVYDPEGEKYAVLVGRFSGVYNEAELGLALADIGITVQKQIDHTTNYLIVGGPLFYDEEGEPVEDPIQPSELTVYKDAVAQGCSIISINDFRQFFRR